jgi:alpha-tubulin suppressor-like RCC1 family protein
LLLDESGNVYGCGSNVVGQLGLGTMSKTSVPSMIDGLASISSVSAGHSHSLFMSDTSIYFTGSNEFGQLCKETNGENLLTPESLDIPGIESSVSFEAIKSSSYILYSDGSVNGCGNNEFGQIGDGTNTNQVLALVALDGVARLLGVGPSAESVFFVTADEYVWGTGLNDRGQLGKLQLLRIE